jgi:dephospho-CoA kinase
VIVIGLTGGIGSGKSTVAARLVERGAVLIDADQVARQVVVPGRPAYARVVDRFGENVVAADGSLDRSAIAAIVFHDPRALADLNAIVHPEVGTEIGARLASEAATDHVVVLDIALLVEGGRSNDYDFAGVLVVDAPTDLALERLVTDRQMDRSDAEARIANQASRSERIRQADFVIMNMGTLDELEEMVARAWVWIEGLVAQAAGGAADGAAAGPRDTNGASAS